MKLFKKGPILEFLNSLFLEFFKKWQNIGFFKINLIQVQIALTIFFGLTLAVDLHFLKNFTNMTCKSCKSNGQKTENQLHLLELCMNEGYCNDIHY